MEPDPWIRIWIYGSVLWIKNRDSDPVFFWQWLRIQQKMIFSQFIFAFEKSQNSRSHGLSEFLCLLKEGS
jgi:hypothetical protein